MPNPIPMSIVVGQDDRGDMCPSCGALPCDWVNDPARAPALASEPFQGRVDQWLLACFGEEIARDRIERNHRFLEEALELVQASGCTASEAHQLVDYTFGRPVGERGQEVGGVMNTLAALCLAYGLDMAEEGDREIARCWEKIDRIREKQAAKPKHSPLPESPTPIIDNEQADEITRLNALIAEAREVVEPFARAASWMTEGYPDDARPDTTMSPTYANYRAASRWLEKATATQDSPSLP